MTLRYAPASPATLLGAPGETRLELKGAATTFTLDVREGKHELRLGTAPEGLQLVVAADDLDGFLSKLLGGTDLHVPIPCRLEWSNRSGLSFSAGAGFAVSVAPHLALGPVVVDRLDLGVTTTVGGPPNLLVETAVTLSGALGPVAFAVEAMGLRLTCRFEDGNAGPFDLGVGFKPPSRGRHRHRRRGRSPAAASSPSITRTAATPASSSSRSTRCRSPPSASSTPGCPTASPASRS